MRRIAPRPVGRPATKQKLIFGHLHTEIVSGKLKPGSRLLTRQQIGRKFSASPMTVQQALNQLTSQGFVVPRGTEGTFVAEPPPHLARYALVFPVGPDESDWARMYGAMANEAIRIQRTQRRTFELFYGLDGHVDNEDYQKLVRDVEAHRIAGIIFATPPHKLKNTPVIEEPGIPRVAIMSRPTADLGNVLVVTPDVGSFISKALDYLVERGRRRIAVLILPPTTDDLQAWALAAALELRGVELRPYWLQAISRDHPRWARNAVHLLMHGNQDLQDRPDGLLITDDNLVEYAAAGLMDAGVRVPQDIDVVAHCNFPWPTPSVVPARRLGFDARVIMEACIDLIDRQRRGEEAPAHVIVPAVFEDELNTIT